MKALSSPANLNLYYHFPLKPSVQRVRPCKCNPSRISINTPPPDFDYRSTILSADSRAAIAETHPQLLDLADNGRLVLVKKSQFGPVPAWRTEFVEPEAIWLVGTSHISLESAVDVERVVRAVKPDNVVVELCRSSGSDPHHHHWRTHQSLANSTSNLTGKQLLILRSDTLHLCQIATPSSPNSSSMTEENNAANPFQTTTAPALMRGLKTMHEIAPFHAHSSAVLVSADISPTFQ